MIAAAMAAAPGDTIRMTGAEPAHLGDHFVEAFRATGVPFELGDDYVDVTGVDVIRPVSVEATPYPGFPTDLQAQWTVLMTQASGPSVVTDSIYADRFKHVPELWRMGVRATVDGKSVHVEGKDGKPIEGTHVMSTDLRASVSLVLAGMVAEGETHVLRVYHLDRGYERLEQKLAAANIAIHREQYTE